MEVFAIVLGSSVLGYMISKIIFNRETERIAYGERKKVQLFLESHILVVEERNGTIQSLDKEKKDLESEVGYLRENIVTLEQQLANSKKESKELKGENEKKYLDKVESCLKEHTRETLEKYIIPLQEKVSTIDTNIKNDNEKKVEELKEKINKISNSHEELHREIIKQIEVASDNTRKHVSECVKIARPPRHIICGSMT